MSGDADGTFSPGAPRGPPGTQPAEHEAPQAPPGLGPRREARPGDKGVKAAAAALLWAGGFILVGAIVAAVWLSNMADWAHTYGSDFERDDAQEMRLARDWTLACGLVLGALPVAAGAGVWYRQPWARPLGVAAGALHLVLVPIGTVLGIIAMVGLLRAGAQEWFT